MSEKYFYKSLKIFRYGDTFYPGGDHATYFESCGVADLITTCYGGRNRKVSEVSSNTTLVTTYISDTVMLVQAFVVRKKSIVELESDMLNGQKLQGPETAAEVNHLLASKGLEAEFPLFTAVHKVSHVRGNVLLNISERKVLILRLFINLGQVCTGVLEPTELIEAIKNHPAHV